MLVTLGSGLALLTLAVAGTVPSALAATPTSTPAMAPLHRLLEADLFVVAPTTLRSSITTAVRRLHRAAAAQPLDAGRVLGETVAAGGVAVSYTMSKLDKLPLGRAVRVTGRRAEELPVAGLGTVGIGGGDAVGFDAVAPPLGVPGENER